MAETVAQALFHHFGDSKVQAEDDDDDPEDVALENAGARAAALFKAVNAETRVAVKETLLDFVNRTLLEESDWLLGALKRMPRDKGFVEVGTVGGGAFGASAVVETVWRVAQAPLTPTRAGALTRARARSLRSPSSMGSKMGWRRSVKTCPTPICLERTCPSAT